MGEDESAVQREVDGSPELIDVVGIGVSADGLISITIGGNGLVESVDFDPRVKRLSAQDLAEQVRVAILAAQQDLLDQSSMAVGAAMDARNKKLDERLDEIRAEYNYQMEQIQHAREEMMRHLKDRRP